MYLPVAPATGRYGVNIATMITTHMINSIIKKTFQIYLWIHVALIVAATCVPAWFIWLPVFFVLYGGFQAAVLLCRINKADLIEMSGFERRSVYIFSFMQIIYTVALMFAGAYGLFGISLDCLRGTDYNDSEFFPFGYSILPNALYFSTVLIWFTVYLIRQVMRKLIKERRAGE